MFARGLAGGQVFGSWRG